MKYLGRKIIFFLIILIPFWSFLVWFFWPKTVFPGLIVDKTVPDKTWQEHRSLNWVLTHEKYVEPNGSQYDLKDDYYGFFPIDRPEYVVKDLTIFNNKEIDSLADALEWLYHTDTYGIYRNEWVYGREINERSPLVYGGTSDEGQGLLREMFKRRKLSITEFNTLASPTPLEIRFKLQRILETDFTGWTGRYYHSLDTMMNRDIPRWMRRLHKQSYGRPFDYPDIPGIVLVHETNVIRVLRGDRHLEHSLPIINTPPENQERFDLPDYMRFPYWFDITFAKDTADILSTYKIHTTSRGDSLLDSLHLPNEFPAVIGDAQENLRYYFCGDFADNPIPFGLSYFAGSQYLRKFFYNNRDELDRKKFFWEYYLPLVSTIFEEYRERMDTLNKGRELPPRYVDYVPYYRRYNIPLPKVGAGTSYRRYDPTEILGSEFIDAAYRDSVRQEQLREARENGFYIGEFGDTIYVEQQSTQDSIRDLRRKQENGDTAYQDSARDFSYGSSASTFSSGAGAQKKDASPSAVNTEADARPSSRTNFKPEDERNAGDAPATSAENSSSSSAAARKTEGSSSKGDSTPVRSDPSSPDREEEPEDKASTSLPADQEDSARIAEKKISGPFPRARYRVGGRRPLPYYYQGDSTTYPVEDQETPKEEDSSERGSKERSTAKEEEPEKAPKEKPTTSSSKEDKYPTNIELEDRYRIIVGSFKQVKDAEEKYNQLSQAPGKMIVYIPKYQVYRVVYGSYDSLSKADEAFLDLLERQSDAWLVKF